MYYDIELLKKASSPEDEAIHRLTRQNYFIVRNYAPPSKFWPQFFLVTPELIQYFRDYALHHVKQIRQKKGYFYRLIDHHRRLFIEPQFDYERFPLVEQKLQVMTDIHALAETLVPHHSSELDATCLYLLYFYGVLANPDHNAITMDYLTTGNKYHAYGARLPDFFRKCSQCQ